LNAEDAYNNFAPSPGRIKEWSPAQGAGIRVDSHCYSDYLVPPFYDSMIGKIVVTGPDRLSTVRRLQAALEDFRIEGLVCNLQLLREIVAHPDFEDNSFHTRWLEQDMLPVFELAKK
jgi:acetyl-CoA carboxylase biotin carboxylase subunit